MKNIKINKEPGYTYNIFNLFSMYFNKSYFEQEPFGYKYAAEDSEYFRDVLATEGYLPISDELILFFYRREDNISFMTQYYYLSMEEDFLTGNYSFSYILGLLTDYTAVISNMIHFYFPDIESIEANTNNFLPQIYECIDGSSYDEKIKCALYSFFLKPEAKIETLIRELREKERIISHNYDNYCQEFKELISNDSLLDILKKTSKQNNNFDHVDNIYVSVGINLRQVIMLYFYDNSVLIITGLDCFKYAEYLASETDHIDLSTFGNALAEKHRMLLLDYIRQKKEVTIKDIQRDLSFTNMNAYYHLTFMIKGSLLKTRNRGRTILYSVNGEGIKMVIKILTTYIDNLKED